MSYKVEAVTAAKSLILGEGPHWDIPTQTLYYVDINGGSVHSYKPSNNEYHSAVIGNGSIPVSLIIPIEGAKNKFIISLKNELAEIEWDGKSSKTCNPKIITTVERKEGTRINDGKADSKGRIWAGTMNLLPESDGMHNSDGSFYKIDNAGNVTKIFQNIHISNGLAWTTDNKKFYYIDSVKFRIDSFDFNNEFGELSNQKTIFDFKENNITGFPDGMTIDSEGKLFVANFDGSQVLRVDPETGKLLTKIPVPAIQTTSVAFGGANLDELYVTSGNFDTTNGKEKCVDGKNGLLYKVTNLGVRGLPMNNVKLNNLL